MSATADQTEPLATTRTEDSPERAKIGFIGCGNIPEALARRWAECGHDVMLSSRTLEKAAAAAAAIGPSVRAGLFADAAQYGDVVVLAVEMNGVFEALEAAGDLAGKVLVDANNLIDRDGWGLQLGFNDSCAEKIARQAPGAKVVKAFNTISAEVLGRRPPLVAGQHVSLFIAGDDDDAKRVVADLGAELGLAPLDCGPLSAARLLEPTAALLVKFIAPFGYGQATSISIFAENPPADDSTTGP